eukprot:TRINITY_DN76158_c0_g1_i1.p1 TRINITY_DN76158_c0_g1~~TRINITY_DN76158_c0_g1_i1.p1  ORF type:complete len:490 (+),score=71.80 TRINITY_DN76158_c0_g1_i1:48-1517(+)
MSEMAESMSLVQGQHLTNCAIQSVDSLPKSAEFLKMNFTEQSMLRNTSFPASCNVPDYFSQINAVLLFETLPQEAALHFVIKTCLCKFIRMRSLAKEDGSWFPVDVDQLKFDYHVTTEPVLESQGELQATVDRLSAEDLDSGFPLWRLRRVPVQKGLSGLIVQVHHCVCDAMHLTKVLCEATDLENGSKLDPASIFEKNEVKPDNSLRNRLCGRNSAIRSVLSNVRWSKRRISESSWHMQKAQRRCGDFCKGQRKVVLVPPFSLNFIKECKKKLGVTGDDVLLAATSGAIRRHCQNRSDPLFSKDKDTKVFFQALLQLKMPASFAPNVGEGDRLTNSWCLCSARLPVGIARPLDRVNAVHKETQRIKFSAKPSISQWVQTSFLGKVPSYFSQRSTRKLFGCHSFVFSNVRYPEEALHLCGQRIEGFYFVSKNVIPQFTLLSYYNLVWMSFTLDPEVIEECDGLAGHFFDELTEIGLAADVDTGVLGERW